MMPVTRFHCDAADYRAGSRACVESERRDTGVNCFEQNLIIYMPCYKQSEMLCMQEDAINVSLTTVQIQSTSLVRLYTVTTNSFVTAIFCKKKMTTISIIINY